MKRPGVIRNYNRYQETQWLPLEQLKEKQVQQLSKMLNFAYQNVPYYFRLFEKLGLTPNDITTIQDLEKLPVLTKQTIKDNWSDFMPRNISGMKFVSSSTGGSTGMPLQYRISNDDWDRSVALLLSGWGYAGYKLGDKIAIIAGTSLIPTKKSSLYKKFQNFSLNHRSYSSFDMSPENLMKYFIDINEWKPDYIRGYASSVYLFSKFIQDNNLKLDFQPKAVFSTAEKLFDKQKGLIETIFNANVFDQYGLNDGGIAAFECAQHSGMHIDMEKAILETVNDYGKQVIDHQGRILATSLYNYAMPFIRYDTGDLGAISLSECACGRKTPILKEVIGRITDFLKINNILIGSPILTVLMGKFDIEQYQIVQEDLDSITCRIAKGKTYKKEDEDFIRDSFSQHVGNVNIEFDYTKSIEPSKAGKHKFIINNLQDE
ncbi:phenylacetate--CoA ligase family protein [Chloroflexota bacterium]